MPTIVVLSGNPRPASKTASVATGLAESLSGFLPASSLEVIELAEFGGRVLDADDADVAAARARAADATLLIVASPAYKGSYTGLLKAFMDGYGPRSLDGVIAVPVIVAGSPTHAILAAHVHLRPLLHEVGAETPLGVFNVLDAEITDVVARAEVIAQWTAERASLIAALGAALGAGVNA